MAQRFSVIDMTLLIAALVFSLMIGFMAGTILSVSADEIGLWDKMHEKAYTADE